MAQGMYAVVTLAGMQSNSVRKMTVTTEAITLCIYENVNLLEPSERGYETCWMAYVHRRMTAASTPISKERFISDFTDLVNAVQGVDKTTMSLPCGSRIVTHCKGEPVAEEGTQYLEMSWEREAWWMENPFIEPMVTAIKDYYPDFAPWKGHKEPLIAALLSRSSLI